MQSAPGTAAGFRAPPDQVTKSLTNSVRRDAATDGAIAAVVLSLFFVAALIVRLAQGDPDGRTVSGGFVLAVGIVTTFVITYTGQYQNSPREIEIGGDSLRLSYPRGRQRRVDWREVKRIRISQRRFRIGRESVYLRLVRGQPGGLSTSRFPSRLLEGRISMLLEERVANVVISSAPPEVQVLRR